MEAACSEDPSARDWLARAICRAADIVSVLQSLKPPAMQIDGSQYDDRQSGRHGDVKGPDVEYRRQYLIPVGSGGEYPPEPVIPVKCRDFVRSSVRVVNDAGASF